MSDKILESGTVHVQDIQMGKKKISDVKIANDEVLFIIFYPFTARRLRPLRWEMNCVYTYLIEHPNYSIVSLVK